MDEKKKENLGKFTHYLLEVPSKVLSFLLENCQINDHIRPPQTYYGFFINSEKFQKQIESKTENILNEKKKKKEVVLNLNEIFMDATIKCLSTFTSE